MNLKVKLQDIRNYRLNIVVQGKIFCGHLQKMNASCSYQLRYNPQILSKTHIQNFALSRHSNHTTLIVLVTVIKQQNKTTTYFCRPEIGKFVISVLQSILQSLPTRLSVNTAIVSSSSCQYCNCYQCFLSIQQQFLVLYVNTTIVTSAFCQSCNCSQCLLSILQQYQCFLSILQLLTVPSYQYCNSASAFRQYCNC